MGLLSWAQRRAIRKLQKNGQWGMSMATEAIPDLTDLAAGIAASLERALHEHEETGKENPQTKTVD